MIASLTCAQKNTIHPQLVNISQEIIFDPKICWFTRFVVNCRKAHLPTVCHQIHQRANIGGRGGAGGGRVEKSKNGINSYGYFFLVAFLYVETRKNIFFVEWTFSKKVTWLTRAPFDLSAKTSRDWRWAPNDLSAKTSLDWRWAQMNFQQKNHVTDACPIWPFSKSVT